MALARRGGADPYVLFDDVLDRAWSRQYARRTKHTEPRWVRELISTTTIRGLNRTAARVYDPAFNKVHFRGGYLHARPYARFQAMWGAGSTWGAGTKWCRRELADALFVVYVTAPDPVTLQHRVVRRAACLLMFKRDQSDWPSTPSFQPTVSPLPMKRGDGDKEQFYLFNQWPSFELQEGSVKKPTRHGVFDIAATSPHELGKYALVWDGPRKWSWLDWHLVFYPDTARWIYSDPVPGQGIYHHGAGNASGSLGYLLEGLVDGVPGIGRAFQPGPWPPSSGMPGWDALMSFLLGYQPAAASLAPAHAGHLSKGTYYGQSRDVNPSKMNFLSFNGATLEHAGIDAGSHLECLAGPSLDFNDEHLSGVHEAALGMHGAARPGSGIRFPAQNRYEDWNGGRDRLPVIVATVHHFQARERGWNGKRPA